LRLHPNGDLLAGDGEAKCIKVISPAGQQTATHQLEFAPESVNVAPDGTIYCGGDGQLAKMTVEGEIVATATMPKPATTEESPRRRGSSRAQRVSGIAVMGDDVFVAFGAGWSMGSKSKLFRFDRDLENPTMVAEGLRGCCQRCDIVARDGILYLAENTVHRVVAMNRDGEVQKRWGERSRTELAGFGSCCNPMNLEFDAENVLYTSESGRGRIKRFSTDGEFLGLVGYVGVERFNRAGRTASSCSNIAIAVTPDGKRVYVMDFKNSLIRVLQRKN